MSARQSESTTKALRAVAKGSTAYAAAKKYGIALSTIYRALDRLNTRGKKPRTSKGAK
jgi:transposase